MRKSLLMGTKADVIKRRAKEAGIPVIDVVLDTSTKKSDLLGYPSDEARKAVKPEVPKKRIATFNHPALFKY